MIKGILELGGYSLILVGLYSVIKNDYSKTGLIILLISIGILFYLSNNIDSFLSDNKQKKEVGK